jgi:hypothetical protein
MISVLEGTGRIQHLMVSKLKCKLTNFVYKNDHESELDS